MSRKQRRYCTVSARMSMVVSLNVLSKEKIKNEATKIRWNLKKVVSGCF